MDLKDSPTAQDLERLADLGISSNEVDRQLKLLRQPPSPVRLVRACQPGDGIARLSDRDQDRCREHWSQLSATRRLVKFVPASGAATRMFKDLTAPQSATDEPTSDGPRRLLDCLPQFAFYEALEEILQRGQGQQLLSLATEGRTEPVLRALLDPEGLDLGDAPKGLVLFHRYPTGSRTAIEEQIWEGSAYLTEGGGPARFHFTVTQAHEARFEQLIARLRPSLESRLGLSLEIDFSNQSPATDTLALETDGRLVRDGDGNLLLRPAGHGALLTNLEAIEGDVLFVKNIDNVSHQRLHALSSHWKRVLAGYFAEIQDEIFALHGQLLERPDDATTVETGLRLLREKLAVGTPAGIQEAPHAARVEYLLDRLDRPLRVCGMVANEGEPGGGPFWLADESGGAAGQIIESAQVDPHSESQQKIWRSATHFNPVDLVCGLRNRSGDPYRLQDFLDPTTSFVAEKSYQGRSIRALERPGLWNGSMARWNTVFVEVPLETFTPVKTVFDLLRPEHQA